MTKFHFLAGLFLTALFSAGLAIADDRPNILWILSDDHSPMNGSYGDDYATTPHIDALADKGSRFKYAFSNAPVCAPARSTLITGIYPTSLGTENMRSVVHTPDEVTFFPAYLRQAGYYTVNVGKHDFNMLEPDGAWTERIKEKNLTDWDRTKYFKETHGNRPFFTIMNLQQAHESRIRGSKTRNRDPENIIHSVDKAPVPDYFPDTKVIRQVIAQYYDNVTEVDTNVGLILKNLVDDGLAENTIVFFFADHGTGIARSKRWPYNSGLQVPFVVYMPKKYQHLAPTKPGVPVEDIVSFVDFAPTTLSLAGVDIPDYMQGRIFLGPNKQPAPEYSFGFRGRMDERFDLIRTARDKRFQYIRNYLPDLPYSQYVGTLYRLQPVMSEWHKELDAGRLNGVQAKWFTKKPPEELYDLENDPWETNNLANNPKYADVVARMRKATENWITEVKDTGFLTEAELAIRAGKHNQAIYDLARNSDVYPFEAIFKAANQASTEGATLADHLANYKSPDPTIRYWGLTGMIRMGRSVQLPEDLLEKALKDDSAIVRVKAAEALCRLDNCAIGLPVLMTVLRDGVGAARLMAISVIDQLDDKAQPALEALEKLSADLALIKTSSSLGTNKPGTEDQVMLRMHREYTKRVLTKAISDLRNERFYAYKK